MKIDFIKYNLHFVWDCNKKTIDVFRPRYRIDTIKIRKATHYKDILKIVDEYIDSRDTIKMK